MQTKRNILVILCDQLRPDFLPVYGCEAVPAPNIERLARLGVVFDRAITQSTVCAPARASMMTGRYVSDHLVWTNDVPFRAGLEYLPELMNGLGYATAAFGKLHHFPAADAKGFRHVRSMEENRLGGQDHYFQWLKARHPEVRGVFNYNPATMTFNFPEAEYYETYLADEAIARMTQPGRHAPDTPFFAWLSFIGPHTPFDPPAEVKGTVQAEKLPRPVQRGEGPMPGPQEYRSALYCHFRNEAEIMRTRVAYAEKIVAIDRQIGRVLDALEASGRLADTTIIFSADHGDLLGDQRQNYKGPFPYQGQLGIPLIVANHPAIVPGSRSQSLAGNIDIPATVLDIAGCARPFGVSRSLLDLGAPTPARPREVIFSEFCDSAKTVDDGRWRYCYYPFSGDAELFDRLQDPLEQHNLAGRPECADIERRLLQRVIDFIIIAKGVRIETHDLVPAAKAGLERLHPEFCADFPFAFPINTDDARRLRAAGLDAGYNDFAKGRQILARYGRLPWEDQNSFQGAT